MLQNCQNKLEYKIGKSIN